VVQMLHDDKIILVYRRTRLEDLIQRYNTIEQAKFYIEHLGEDFSKYLNEHRHYKKVIDEAMTILSSLGRLQGIERGFLPNFIFGENDLVVVIGQDGLVANTLKYLSKQFVIGVNPDRKSYDGVLLPFDLRELSYIVKEVFQKKRVIKEVSMAKASLNDGQIIYGVNDLFIGQRSHVSSRYGIQLGMQSENQSSSGIIVSTGLGSTGWLKSIVQGANKIASSLNGENIESAMKTMKWNSQELVFTVREPFPSKVTKTELVFGSFSNESPLIIKSYMPEGGVIFSDGIETDYLNFNSGFTATISVADKKGFLVV
jgi:NAD kinase